MFPSTFKATDIAPVPVFAQRSFFPRALLPPVTILAVLTPSSGRPGIDGPVFRSAARQPRVRLHPELCPAVAQSTLPSMGPARGHRRSADLAHPGVGRRWPGGRAGSSRPHGSALSVTDRTLNPAERRRSPICDCSTNNFFFLLDVNVLHIQ